jgi:putative flippase GtrA
VSSFAPGSVVGQVVRFVAVGGTNTLVTGAIFLGLSTVVPPAAAYTAAFAFGVVFALVVTPRFVFSEQASHNRRAIYGAWYLVVYVVGLGVVYLVHDVLGLDRLAIVAVTVPTTAVLGFLGARRLFHGSTAQGGA